MRKLLFCFIFLFLSAPSANAQSYTLCVTQNESDCAGAHDAYLPCGVDVHGWARSACTVHGSNAEPRYTLVKTHDESHTRCGIMTFEITCK